MRVDSTRVRLETKTGRYMAAFDPSKNWQIAKLDRLDA